MSYFIYILYSAGSDVYYVGQTTDVELRFFQHNNSERLTYTSKHRPWTLKCVFSCGGSISLATKAERYIKRQKSRKFIEHPMSTLRIAK